MCVCVRVCVCVCVVCILALYIDEGSWHRCCGLFCESEGWRLNGALEKHGVYTQHTSLMGKRTKNQIVGRFRRVPEFRPICYRNIILESHHFQKSHTAHAKVINYVAMVLHPDPYMFDTCLLNGHGSKSHFYHLLSKKCFDSSSCQTQHVFRCT